MDSIVIEEKWVLSVELEIFSFDVPSLTLHEIDVVKVSRLEVVLFGFDPLWM